MNFDHILDDMLAAAKGELTSAGPEARTYFEQVLRQKKDELRAIAAARLRGDLTDADVKWELDALKGDAAASLEGVGVIAKEAAQRAWDSAADTFLSALAAAL
jgi:hypothetical protein